MTEKLESTRTPKQQDTTRGYTVPVPEALAIEIRQVAASMGLPIAVVREIATATAVEALTIITGGVRKAVAAHFAAMAEKS